MNCHVVKDLMPMYVENMCSVQTAAEVAEHLADCEECKEFMEDMKLGENLKLSPAEAEMAKSLKNVRRSINKRVKRAAVGTAVAAVLLFGGYLALFQMPLKDVAPEDINVSVQMYPIDELAAGEYDSESVHISIYEDDSEYVTLNIPEAGGAHVSVSESLTEKYEYLSVIKCSSPYNLRELNWTEGPEEDALYLDSAKTTILNSKAPGDIHHAQMEFKEINKIIYVGEGVEEVLWSR